MNASATHIINLIILSPQSTLPMSAYSLACLFGHTLICLWELHFSTTDPKETFTYFCQTLVALCLLIGTEYCWLKKKPLHYVEDLQIWFTECVVLHGKQTLNRGEPSYNTLPRSLLSFFPPQHFPYLFLFPQKSPTLAPFLLSNDNFISWSSH